MEIQIPLVIFTSFLAWAAGIFGTQCILALQKRGGAVQLPALICSAVVLVVGGIAVVFHLTHPFNLFNGFGHITSGITQELIAIVLLAVVMVLFFLMLRRSEDDTVPQWLAVVGIVVVLVLIVAMGHSYMMPSLPAWDTVLQLLSLLGAACVMGPATVAFIGAVKGVEIEGIGLLTVIGAAVNAVLSAAYMFAMEASSATFQSFQYYFDPTPPERGYGQPGQCVAVHGRLAGSPRGGGHRPGGRPRRRAFGQEAGSVEGMGRRGCHRRPGVRRGSAHHDVHHGRDPVHAVLAGFGEAACACASPPFEK